MFVATVEDTGKLAFSDCEDEIGSKASTEKDKLSDEGKTIDLSRNTLPSNSSTNNENTAPGNLENEHNSRSLTLGEEESLLKCIVEEAQPSKISSNTSIRNKEVIESKFREQKTQLNVSLFKILKKIT